MLGLPAEVSNQPPSLDDRPWRYTIRPIVNGLVEFHGEPVFRLRLAAVGGAVCVGTLVADGAVAAIVARPRFGGEGRERRRADRELRGLEQPHAGDGGVHEGNQHERL